MDGLRHYDLTRHAAASGFISIDDRNFSVPAIYPPFYPDEESTWESYLIDKGVDEVHCAKFDKQYRAYYGEDLFTEREATLNGRNPYISFDSQYKKRQMILRRVENDVSGRLFPGGMEGEVWAGVWKRLQERKRVHAGQSRTQLPPDEEQKLQCERDVFGWSEEELEFNRCLRKTKLSTEKRSQYEDLISSRQVEKDELELKAFRDQVEASPLPRSSVAFERLFNALGRKTERLRSLRCGMPREEVEEAFRLGEEAAKQRMAAEDELLARGPRTEAELMAKLMQWQWHGLVGDEHNTLARLYKSNGVRMPRLPRYDGDKDAFTGYDYFSLRRRGPETRPRPSREEMMSLAKDWRSGLILNQKEINALFRKYGYKDLIQSPPRQESHLASAPNSRKHTRNPSSGNSSQSMSFGTSSLNQLVEGARKRGRPQTSNSILSGLWALLRKFARLFAAHTGSRRRS